ncbi:MAG: hypothetical protein F7B59_00320 [Desulfurococcales archaeon]|nr:hypothetical protein [Desulfurococcales archaeon]
MNELLYITAGKVSGLKGWRLRSYITKNGFPEEVLRTVEYALDILEAVLLKEEVSRRES